MTATRQRGPGLLVEHETYSTELFYQSEQSRISCGTREIYLQPELTPNEPLWRLWKSVDHPVSPPPRVHLFTSVTKTMYHSLMMETTFQTSSDCVYCPQVPDQLRSDDMICTSRKACGPNERSQSRPAFSLPFFELTTATTLRFIRAV